MLLGFSSFVVPVQHVRQFREYKRLEIASMCEACGPPQQFVQRFVPKAGMVPRIARRRHSQD